MNPSCLVIRFLTLSAVLVVLVGLQPALAQDQPRRASPIGAGKTLNGELAPGEILDFELDAAEGDYVRGNITGGGVTLSLVDQTGKRERLLGRGTGEQEAIHFMVGSGGPWRLAVFAKTTIWFVLMQRHLVIVCWSTHKQTNLLKQSTISAKKTLSFVSIENPDKGFLWGRRVRNPLTHIVHMMCIVYIMHIAHIAHIVQIAHIIHIEQSMHTANTVHIMHIAHQYI